jgi:hypothetical protein
MPMGDHRKTASALRSVASRLLAACAGLREQLRFPVDSGLLNRWTYLPGPRPGLVLGAMSKPQRMLVHQLLELVLSEACHAQLATIMALEDLLDRREGHRNGRHSTDFWVLMFGDPDADATWSWRLEGHHACVHVTVAGDDVAVDPLFLGCHPAVIAQAGRVVTAPLAHEEGLARDLVLSLPPADRARVITADSAPQDIYSGTAAELSRQRLDRLREGIPIDALDRRTAGKLAVLLDLYSARLAEPLAGELRAVLDADSPRLCWQGSTEPGRQHYYRLTGTSFLIEHENSANHANHVHNVMRRQNAEADPEDLLRQHRAADALGWQADQHT